jgi:ubiquitin-protein ligase
MRAIITGPCGTPYESGLFMFDILFPLDYPQVPPKVKFLTTGQGTVRFNPNLYADGKVTPAARAMKSSTLNPELEAYARKPKPEAPSPKP